MDDIYRKALDGTLLSTQGNSISGEITFTNKLDVPIDLYWVGFDGAHLLWWPNLAPNQVSPVLTNAFDGWYFVIATAFSGAFVSAFKLSATNLAYSIGVTALCKPNDCGPNPVPNAAIKIPPDSPRVLVASGTAPNGNVVTREQYWRRGDDSIMLAPGETRDVSYTTTSGKQSTTSEESTLATSLGISTTAGWGPISASVSASLNTSSTSFQQVTVSTESSQYESHRLVNDGDLPQLFLKWQLIDVVTVFDHTALSKPVASIISAANPSLVAGPYNPMDLPAPFTPPDVADEMWTQRPTLHPSVEHYRLAN